MENGSIVKFNHTFNTPEFEASDFTFLDQKFHETVEDKQIDWLDKNYHFIVEQCEKRHLHPIIGFNVVRKKELKISKKQQILDILSKIEMSEQMLGTVLGTLATLWPNIKQLSIEKILTTVLESNNISYTVALFHMRSISETFINPEKLLNNKI